MDDELLRRIVKRMVDEYDCDECCRGVTINCLIEAASTVLDGSQPGYAEGVLERLGEPGSQPYGYEIMGTEP